MSVCEGVVGCECEREWWDVSVCAVSWPGELAECAVVKAPPSSALPSSSSPQDVSGKLSGGKPPKPRGETGGKGISVAASQRQSRLSASSSSSDDSDDSSSSGSGSSTSSDSESEKGHR